MTTSDATHAPAEDAKVQQRRKAFAREELVKTADYAVGENMCNESAMGLLLARNTQRPCDNLHSEPELREILTKRRGEAQKRGGGRGKPNAPQIGTSQETANGIADQRGNPIPLAVAKSLHQEHPDLVCVSGDFWDFTGKVFEQLDPEEIDAGAIIKIGTKARRSNLGDIRHLLRVECHKPKDYFDQQNRRIIVLENGTLDVFTRELMAHSPNDRARNLLPVSFDPKADCPVFRRCLQEWQPDDPGARDFLVEWMGYCLIPDTTQEIMAMLIGEGANGKGRLIRALETLLGSRNVSGLPLASLRSDRTFPTAGLQGKLLNICPESELSGTLDEGWIKSLVSGDSVEVERKGRDPFTMRPVARFIIQSNNPPHINDKSQGIWRRLVVVRFGRTFADDERDSTLDSKLAAELPGILNLALEGLQRLTWRGCFDLTEKMKADRDSYRKDCNPLETWKDEKICNAEPDYAGRPARVSGDSAYRSYKEWCKDNGHTPYARSKFTREMQRLGVEYVIYKEDGLTTRGFQGVRLV